ncbi:MAG: 3-dehydroquinate synthase [Candidatus Zixiibacteriota bacterium]|nr:MAG: 3-dehydroquinate synthase [candidate division Zixibacteria bacterium]
MPEIRVRHASGSCPVFVCADDTDRLRVRLKRALGKHRLFAFYDAQFYALHGRRLRSNLKLPAGRIAEMVIPVGEKSKSLRTLKSVYDFLLTEEISRTDLILACGGGVTTDLVGYAAATMLRGIPWVAVPTTLLGMVDAAIGGKTGINHDLGKNLVGAFWQPHFVHADIRFLQTLPLRHMVAGLGEVLKCSGLAGTGQVRLLTDFLAGRDLYNERPLKNLIRMSAGLKAEIVSHDERETGMRVFLNYGHTIGHAIEQSLRFARLLHGEAVILGILGALELADLLRVTTGPAIDEYRHLVLDFVGLVPRRKLTREKIIAAMTLDKKRSGTDLNYVLLKRPGKPQIVAGIPRRTVARAIERMLTLYEKHGGRGACRSGC